MDVGTLFFWIIAAVVGGSAIMVVVTQNIVRAAVWLLFTLAGTSFLYFQLNADFVGATQLIVYVGGTLVLVVFGVMLTAQGPLVSLRTGPGEWAVATVAGLLFLGVLMASTTGMKSTKVAEVAPSVKELGEGFLGLIEATDKDLKHTKHTRQLTGYPEGVTAPDRSRVAYLLPFEIVSVHLLVVLIGAAYLARAKRRSGGHA